MTKVLKNNAIKSQVTKGLDVTWNEATFTWDEGNESTWNGIGSIKTNVVKSLIVKHKVLKS